MSITQHGWYLVNNHLIFDFLQFSLKKILIFDLKITKNNLATRVMPIIFNIFKKNLLKMLKSIKICTT